MQASQVSQESRTPVEDGFDQQISKAQGRLRELTKRLSKAVTALTPLTKAAAYEDMKKLGKVLKKVETKIPPDLREEAGLRDLLAGLRTYHDTAGERIRQRLGQELRAACEEAKLGFRVISRENPVEVRIPPLSVILDFERGQAEIRFARVELARCAADARSILRAHETARKSLDRGFDAEKLFRSCLRAWRAALAARGAAGARGGADDRVEILEFLPYLAVEMQPRKFRADPTHDNFRGYGSARFAWDVLRLRRDRRLVQGGWRMNLGVATGTTASEKHRVIYFEDEDGRGEYKLTVFFTRTEEGDR